MAIIIEFALKILERAFKIYNLSNKDYLEIRFDDNSDKFL